MQERLNTKLRGYFADGEDKVYERVLNADQSGQLTEFYVMLVLSKLSNREVLVAFIQAQKRAGNLKEELLLDCLWSLALYLDNHPLLKQLNELIMDLSARGILDRALTIQMLTDKTLAECKLVDQEPFNKKVSRMYTKHNFEQTKFNLLREANQGYSKVTLLLLSLRDNDDLTRLYQNIVGLIGNFDLDPDRIIDLILEGFIQNSQVRLYVELLKKFERSSIPPILCQRLAKLSSELAEKMVTYESVDYFLTESLGKLLSQEAWTPNIKFMRVVALLLKNQLIRFEQISNSLTPSEQFFEKDAIRRIELGKTKFSESFVMNTEELTEKQKKEIEKSQKVDFFGQYLYSSRLWLLCQLAAINDWTSFSQMWFLYSNHFDLLTHQPTLRALFKLLDWSIDKVYKVISYSKYFKKTSNKVIQSYEHFTDNSLSSRQVQQVDKVCGLFFDQIENILSVVKSYIGFNTALYIKLCRIFRKLLVNPDLFGVLAEEQMEEYRIRIREIAKTYLVPAVCAQRGNPSLQTELYPLLMLIEDFKFRYDAYLQSQSKLILANPYFCYQYLRAKKDQNVIFNTLSTERKKQYIKRVAKICSNHSFYVFYWVITKRLISDSQKEIIPEFVAVLMNCTKFSLDVLIYIVLHTIVQSRNPINLKTLDLSPWYRNCFILLGLFYRKYPETDLMPTINYVLAKLNRPIRDVEDNSELESLELKVLKEVIGKMTGVSIPEEINKNLLMIMASGTKLQSQTLNLSSDSKPTKKSKSQLETFFYTKSLNFDNGRSLAFFLLVLMAQKRTEAILKSVSFDVKLLAQVYDEYTTSIVQLVKVLTLLASDYQQYAKLLPANSLRLMIIQYKIPIELAFHIFRNSIKNTSSMASDEWASILKQVSKVIEEVLNEGQALTARGYTQNPNLFSFDPIKQKFKKCMTYELYSSFWLLNLDSIYYPQALYEEKIEELKKKIAGWRVSDRVDKELDKTKSLLEKIVKESEVQKKKYNETMEEVNKHKIMIGRLGQKKTDKADDYLTSFAEIFSQTCILPRLLLEPRQALYCAKFVILFIKANQLFYNRCLKLINSLLENVMTFLPFSTHRESICISVFVSELLSIFSNWNDPEKLKNDLLTKLGTDQSIIKDNYAKMKDYLLRLFERISNCIKNVKEEPYIIKNALYLLDKLEVIPAYRQQAEQLEQYIRDLKETYGGIKGMNTILERQAIILSKKKNSLPDRPLLDDKKNKANVNAPQTSTTPPPGPASGAGSTTPPPSRPAVYAMLERNDDKDRERDKGQKEKQQQQGQQSKQQSTKEGKAQSQQSTTPHREGGKQPSTTPHRQAPKQAQPQPAPPKDIKSRFSTNNEKIAAHLSSRDVEKGEITAAVEEVAPATRTVKMMKELKMQKPGNSQLQPDQKSEGEIKDTKDNKDSKDSKDNKDNKDSKDSKEPDRERTSDRDHERYHKNRDTRDNRDDRSKDKYKDRDNRDNREREARQREREAREKASKEKEAREKEARQAREKQAKEKQAREAREKQQRDKEARERQQRQKEARQREAREKEERQARERQQRERQLREKEQRQREQREREQREKQAQQAREKERQRQARERQARQARQREPIKVEQISTSKQEHQSILQRIKNRQGKKDDPTSTPSSNQLMTKSQLASVPATPQTSQPFYKDHSTSSRRDDRDRKDDKRDKDDRRYDRKDDRGHDKKHYDSRDSHRRSRSRHRR